MSTTITTTFIYTGAVQTYVVPAGVTSVTIMAKGASGAGWGPTSTQGGQGATCQGTYTVTPGATIYVYVGGGGQQGNQNVPGAAGYNGGGTGGVIVTVGGGAQAGNGGGGRSYVANTLGGSAFLLAGGGGGAAADGYGGGGGAIGANGLDAVSITGTTANCGKGATPSAPGAAGGGGGAIGSAGDVLGVGIGGTGGGNGGTAPQYGGGAGGGGIHGGGGGGGDAGTGLHMGAGGGGSSFQTGGSSLSSSAGGFSPYAFINDGQVTISYTDTAPNAPTLTTPANNGFTDVTNPVLGWTFSDPDAGDTQSSADVRYRVLGSTIWTTVNAAAQNGTTTYNPVGLVQGAIYEWQARTYDQLGLQGAWSASSTFTTVPHPSAVITNPTINWQPVTIATHIGWAAPLRNQSGYNIRRVADLNGQPDLTNIIESAGFGSSTAASSALFTVTTHPDGPEHWQIQFRTNNDQVLSQWYDFPVTMSTDAPPLPTCTATAQPGSASALVVATYAILSIDYYFGLTAPTTAGTGQALTTTGTVTLSGGAGGNGAMLNDTGLFGQQATISAKVASMSVTFQSSIGTGTNNGNVVRIIARDASNNAHFYIGVNRGGWAIAKDVAGTVTTVSSASFATNLLAGQPYTIQASLSGTTVTFTDPFGATHTATDAVFGSFTGTIAQVQVDNTVTAAGFTWQIRHWSADVNANPPQSGYIARSIDGVNFARIPSALWGTGDYPAQFSFTDYEAPLNTQVYYRTYSYAANGALIRSVVS